MGDYWFHFVTQAGTDKQHLQRIQNLAITLRWMKIFLARIL